jgi:hypothetical protein
MARSSQLCYRITNYRHSENLNISPTSSTDEPASQIYQRLSEIADPHGLTIVQPLSDLSSRLANFEGDSGIKVEFYQWNGNGKKTATSQVDQTIGVFVPPDAPALIGPVTFSIDAYHGTPPTPSTPPKVSASTASAQVKVPRPTATDSTPQGTSTSVKLTAKPANA